jgi:hypothetical protein
VIGHDDKRCFWQWCVLFEADRIKAKNTDHPTPEDENFKPKLTPRFIELERPEKRIEKDSKNKEN